MSNEFPSFAELAVSPTAPITFESKTSPLLSPPLTSESIDKKRETKSDCEEGFDFEDDAISFNRLTYALFFGAPEPSTELIVKFTYDISALNEFADPHGLFEEIASVNVFVPPLLCLLYESRAYLLTRLINECKKRKAVGLADDKQPVVVDGQSPPIKPTASSTYGTRVTLVLDIVSLIPLPDQEVHKHLAALELR